MTAILLRLLIFAVIVGAIGFGIRKIWREWTGAFRVADRERRQRDLAERGNPDVIDLRRGNDGVYRPPGGDDRR